MFPQSSCPLSTPRPPRQSGSLSRSLTSPSSFPGFLCVCLLLLLQWRGMTPGPGGLSSEPTPGKFEGSPSAFWASLALLSSALEKGGEVWRNHPALGRQESCLRDSSQFRRLTLQVRNDILTLPIALGELGGQEPRPQGLTEEGSQNTGDDRSALSRSKSGVSHASGPLWTQGAERPQRIPSCPLPPQRRPHAFGWAPGSQALVKLG